MADKIMKMTPEQEAKMPIYRDKWIALGLSTEPADSERAERGIRHYYERAGIAHPKAIVWVPSPIVGAIAVPIAAAAIGLLRAHAAGKLDGMTPDQIKRAVGSAVGSAVGRAVDRAVRSAVGRAVGSAVGSAVDGDVGSAVGRAVYSAVDSAVYSAVRSAVDGAVDSAVYSAVRSAVDGDVDRAVRRAVYSAVDSAVYSAVGRAVGSDVDSAVYSAVDSDVDSAVYSAVDSDVDGAEKNDALARVILENIKGAYWRHLWGNHSSGWASWVDFIHSEIGVDMDRAEEAIVDVASSCGWWWPYPDFAMACDRPDRLERDERGRLHSDSGPAIRWRDGWGLHFWHGTAVTAKLIEAPDTLTTEDVRNEHNSEVMRATSERLGAARFAELLGVETIDTWEDARTGLRYELLEPRTRLDAAQARYLRMQSPVLHDGTQPTYTEPVHPELQTAQAARRWKFPENLTAMAKRHGDVVIDGGDTDFRWPSAEWCNRNPELDFVEEA